MKLDRTVLTGERLLPYGIALGSVALSLGISLQLGSLIKPMPASLFFLAVMVSAWYGGLKPGLVATVVSTFAISYYFIPPYGSLRITDLHTLFRLGVFVLVALLTSSLNESRRIALRHAEIMRRRSEAAQEEVQATKQHLERVLCSIHDGFYVLDRHWRYTYVNDRYCEMAGMQREAILGENLWQLFPDGVDTLFDHHLQRAIDKQIPLQFEYFYGAWQRWYEHRVYPSPDGITVFVNEITDHKQVQVALRQSQERFRISQELSLDAFTILNSVRDQTGTIVDFVWIYANPKAAEILQYSVDQLIGQRLLDLLPGNQTNSDLFDRYVRVVETGEPHDIELAYNSEGISGWFRNMAVKLEDGVAIFFSDITDRKQAEAERERLLKEAQAARAEAEAANRIKDEFLAVLSHELRSPLNPILGWTQLMQSQRFDAAKTTEALAAIERNAKLQTQLIDDLLDVAKILRGKMSLNRVPVNLMFVIKAAIDIVMTAAVAKSIQLHSELAQIGAVYGDAGRLQQVIWNLLSNAIKFTPAGGRVEIRLKRVEQQLYQPQPNSLPSIHPLPTTPYAHITVSDTGKGINPNFLPYIFESFHQEDASITRKYGGLGLGLAIVRYLVEAHGGTVTAESPGEGQGATFTVCLPLLDAEPDIHQTDSPSEPELDLSGIRVLTVDDQPDTGELLNVVLTQYGANVLTVTSAAEVLPALASFQPDVFVSDIGMPEVDGYTLLQQIRLLPPEQGGQVPAIALTAYAGELNYQRAMAVGFQRHLSKPVEPKVIAREIASLIVKRTAAQ